MLNDVSDANVIEAYEHTGSVHRAGVLLNVHGQTVANRLNAIGYRMAGRAFSEEEYAEIRKVYESGLVRGDGKLDKLCRKLGRQKTSVSRVAKQLGLTTYHRKCTKKHCENISARATLHIKNHGHPRGMLGKCHTEEARAATGRGSKDRWDRMTPEEKDDYVHNQLKGRYAKYGTLSMHVRPHTTWKAGKRTVGEQTVHFRSRWEANYARYLNYSMRHGTKHVLKWEFEPETFWFKGIKRGCVSYLPDFRVQTVEGTHYVEVKGWMDPKSKTKIKRMAKYHPHIKLVVVDTPVYQALEKEYQHQIIGWES